MTDMPQLHEKIRKIDQDNTSQVIVEAGDTLREGGLVVFPTETVYGIAAPVHHGHAQQRLRELKGRQDGQPFTLHLGSTRDILLYTNLNKRHQLKRLLRKMLPGPATFIIEMEEEEVDQRVAALQTKMQQSGLVEDLTKKALKSRLYYENAIGIRCPDMTIAERVLSSVPLKDGDGHIGMVATSANLKGEKAPVEVSQLSEAILSQVDLVIDGGLCQFSKASTILRYDLQGQIQIEREGVFDARYIEKMGIMKVLFVCSGNTCRSPMAEGLAKAQLANLGHTNIEVISAGTSTFDGMPASPEAVTELSKRGINIAEHRSRMLTPDLLADADWVFCMTESHLQAAYRLMNRTMEAGASESEKVQRLDKSDVVDPIGSGASVYASCAKQIDEAIATRLEEIFR